MITVLYSRKTKFIYELFWGVFFAFPVLPSKAMSNKCMEKTKWNTKYNKARIGKVSKHRCTCGVKGLREFWCPYQHHTVHQADCDWSSIKNVMASPTFFNGLVDIVIFNGKGSLVYILVFKLRSSMIRVHCYSRIFPI